MVVWDEADQQALRQGPIPLLQFSSSPPRLLLHPISGSPGAAECTFTTVPPASPLTAHAPKELWAAAAAARRGQGAMVVKLNRSGPGAQILQLGLEE